MNCPVCFNHALKPITVSGVQVDCCKQCGGAWYDKGEFEKLVKVAMIGFVAKPNAPTSDRRCPRDGDRLKVMTYPQTLVSVDICQACQGIWLDDREITEIRKVRHHLDRAGSLDKYAAVPGLKGKLIRFINGSIDSLLDYSDHFEK